MAFIAPLIGLVTAGFGLAQSFQKPKAAPAPAPLPAAPTVADASAQAAADAAKKRQISVLSGGQTDNNILPNSGGGATVGTKSLLGQ